jgi:hypothetical protein
MLRPGRYKKKALILVREGIFLTIYAFRSCDLVWTSPRPVPYVHRRRPLFPTSSYYTGATVLAIGNFVTCRKYQVSYSIVTVKF